MIHFYLTSGEVTYCFSHVDSFIYPSGIIIVYKTAEEEDTYVQSQLEIIFISEVWI